MMRSDGAGVVAMAMRLAVLPSLSFWNPFAASLRQQPKDSTAPEWSALKRERH